MALYIIKSKYLKNRLRVSMIKPDQFIKIERDDALHKICTAKCISNDTYTKKILIEIFWENSENKQTYKKQYILPYSSKEFRNFHLLNERDFKLPEHKEKIKIHDNSPSAKREKTKQKILELKNKLKIHIQEEEYEKARKVQDEIDSLNKKLK
jgi:excinuclease UvrABC helicase subunit UvrB